MSDHLNGLGSFSVFRFTLDASETPVIEHTISRDFLSYPGTVKEVVNHSSYLPSKFKCGLTLLTQEEIYDFLAFCNAVRGRRLPFWIPLPLKLFTQTATYISGSTQINIVNNEFIRCYQGFERLFLSLYSGDLLTYKITAVSYGLDPSDPYLVSLGTAINRDIAEIDVRFFSLLYLVRLDDDEISMDYISPELAKVSLNMVELPREYPA